MIVSSIACRVLVHMIEALGTPWSVLSPPDALADPIAFGEVGDADVIEAYQRTEGKRWRCISIVLPLALSALAPAAALAGGTCPAVTRVGVSDLGYSAFRDGDRIGGMSIDIAEDLARRTGCKVEFRWFPRQRLFVELAAGRIDMTMGAMRTPERDAYAVFLPYAYVQYDLILSRETDRHFTSLADFVARGSGRLNVVRGMTYDAEIDTQLAMLTAAGRLEVVNDFDTVFSKLEIGRAGGTLATPPIYEKYLETSRLKHRSAVISLPESSARFTGVYLSKQTTTVDTQRRFASALKTMVAEQAIQPLFEKYFDNARVKRFFKPGPARLTAALSAAEAGLKSDEREEERR